MMPSSIEQFLLGRIQESPYQKQKPTLSKIEETLLAQVEALKPFKPESSQGSTQSPLI
jgi:hypothetical protein